MVLSNADQHLVGVEIALKDAGIDLSKVYLMGGGLNQITVDAIRAGQASATLADHPYLTGVEAMKALHTTLTGGTAPTAINVLKLGTTPLIVDKAWLDAHPDFKAEWQG